MSIDQEALEEEGRSEMEFSNLDVVADSIDTYLMFHLLMDILRFVLFMHQQIPL
ncbi:hypothetical protein HanIR_Chr11g0547331 [Helianthus annuus]|nr:hypothetical protein HanIR_Chr11g0547331 [Helianthus annuus]